MKVSTLLSELANVDPKLDVKATDEEVGYSYEVASCKVTNGELVLSLELEEEEEEAEEDDEDEKG